MMAWAAGAPDREQFPGFRFSGWGGIWPWQKQNKAPEKKRRFGESRIGVCDMLRLIQEPREILADILQVRLRNTIRWLAALTLGIFALALINNNWTPRKPSRETFLRRLDQASREATGWVLANGLEDNYYLLYVLLDCSRMTGELPLAQFVARSAALASDRSLERLIDPGASYVQPPESYLSHLANYQLWTLYAISRKEFALSEEERTNMFAPGKYRTGKATHQLISLVVYRQFNGATPELDAVIRRISERVAQEAALDFRITDLYLQRIASLLAAGQPDLVRPRWVERALNAQQDGGWYYSWYGWQPTPYRFKLEDAPQSHSTVQGLWLAVMLQHRYPQWVSANFH